MSPASKEIIETLTIQNRDVLLEKYRLHNPVERPELAYYHQRGAVLGEVGGIQKNITTGPCLLGLSDIERIKNEPESFHKVVSRQPTLQNVLNVGYQADGDIHICLETHEFAHMAADIFEMGYDAALSEFIRAAERTERIIRLLHKNSSSTLHFHHTHDPKVDAVLRRITESRYEEFLTLMEKKKGERKILARIRKQVEAGRDPNEIFKLRIYATYTPGWWDGTKTPHTIIENIYNVNKYIDTDLNPSWTALVPLRSMDWKREMAQGGCINVGNKEEIKKAVALLEKKLPQKSPHQCNVGNILPYADEDLDTLVQCYSNRTMNTDRCNRCFERVKNFLLKISDAL